MSIQAHWLDTILLHAITVCFKGLGIRVETCKRLELHKESKQQNTVDGSNG